MSVPEVISEVSDKIKVVGMEGIAVVVVMAEKAVTAVKRGAGSCRTLSMCR